MKKQSELVEELSFLIGNHYNIDPFTVNVKIVNWMLDNRLEFKYTKIVELEKKDV